MDEFVLDLGGDAVGLEGLVAEAARKYNTCLPEAAARPRLRVRPVAELPSGDGCLRVHAPRLDWCFDPARAVLFIRARRPLVRVRWKSAVRAAYHALAMQHDDPVLHAAALACPEGALLFAGRARAGKTTVARLLGGRCSVLDDDMTFLHTDPDGRPAVRSTAFLLGLGGAGPSAPIARVYLIERGEACRVLGAVSPAAAAARLTIDLFGRGAPEALARRAARIARALRGVPVTRLAVVPDGTKLARCLGLPDGTGASVDRPT